jgi:hypothetical protein
MRSSREGGIHAKFVASAVILTCELVHNRPVKLASLAIDRRRPPTTRKALIWLRFTVHFEGFCGFMTGARQIARAKPARR